MMAYEPPDFYEFEVSPELHGHPPAMPIVTNAPPSLHYSSEIAALQTALMTGAVVSFIVLMAKDAHKALITRAHWIPCDFLVLSAFSIQMLSLLNAQNEAVETSSTAGSHWVIKAGGGTGGGGSTHTLWKDFLTIHNSRTILCVFAAYVMPAMADRGLEHSWVRWVALVITVFHHVSSEFYIVKPDNKDFPNVLRLWPQQHHKSDPSYHVYATVISLCFISLILLLASATIAGTSIERIVAKKIRLVFKGEGELCDGEPSPHPHRHAHHYSCWQTVQSDINTVDHHHRVPLHHSTHDHHDHSCLREVEEVIRAGKADVNQHQHCWRRVEEVLRRGAKEGSIDDENSCWKTTEDGLRRGEKAEEEHLRRHCRNCWGRVEDTVLKAWIIVRAYSTQPVIARSALTAAAAVIVTIQIAITIVAGLANEVNGQDLKAEKINFKIIATIMQSVFILLAWVLINLRWGIAAAYHRRSQAESWRSDLRMEDFWTRYLRELQDAGESRLSQAQSIENKVEPLVSKENKTTSVPSVLLYTAFGMQWFLVSFSKVCWVGSLFTFHNKLMGMLYNLLFGKNIMYVFEEYPKYRKILEDVKMLGESPESLWVANRKSIVKAKNLTTQGNQDGEHNCEELVEFVSTKKTENGLGLSCLYPHKPQNGLNFLCKKRPTHSSQQGGGGGGSGGGGERQPLEEQFTGMSKKSWKMSAVSLLSIIFHLSPLYADADKEPRKVVVDCMNAYSEAWEIIDFVEETDTEPDGVTSEAADKCFKFLQKKVAKRQFPPNNLSDIQPAELVRTALEELKKESIRKIEPVESGSVLSRLIKKEKAQGFSNGWKGNDSIDWKEAASSLAVYNLCNSIEWNDGSNVSELLKELESSLADIIMECLERVQHLLLLNSRKWALNRDERRLGKALYTAGKAKVIMEKLVWNPVAIVCYH